MPLDSKQKLALYRKLESDVSGGVLLALDIFNEECGKLVEEKKQEMEDILAQMDKEIKAKELKDGKTPTKEELSALMAPALSKAVEMAVRDAGKKMEVIQRNMIASVRNGNDGMTPKAGKDYPTTKQMQDFVAEKMQSMRPKDGLTPSEKYLGELIKRQMPEPIDFSALVEKTVKSYIDHPSFTLGAEKIRNLPRLPKGTKGKYHAAHGGGDSSGSGTSVFEEVPAGSGTSFTLAHTPIAGTLRLFRGGARQQAGAGKDYTLSGTTITLALTLVSGEVLVADYLY